MVYQQEFLQTQPADKEKTKYSDLMKMRLKDNKRELEKYRPTYLMLPKDGGKASNRKNCWSTQVKQ